MVKWLVIFTICLSWFGALVVWVLRDNHPQLQHWVASGFAVIAGLTSIALIPFATADAVLIVPVGGVFGDFTFVPDGLGVLLAAVANVIGSLAVIFSMEYMHGEPQLTRYYTLVLIFIGAMAGLVLSGSLLLMFLFWEITAFCSYALISFHNDDPKAVAGGIKALLMTQFGGVGLLAGALIAYAYLGSYQINTFLAKASALPIEVLSLIAFGYLAAAIAKSAQVPLHTWLPDAMEAPTPVTALIHAATIVNAGVYLLARFYPVFAPVPGWKVTVIIIGIMSALLAAILASTTFDLKRALAFSTISQLGYMFYAVGVGDIFASQFHLFSHAIFKGLLFLGAGAVIHTIGTRDMRQMGKLGEQMPYVRLIFMIGAFALAGIPITNGFFSKELVLEGGLQMGPIWSYTFMVIGASLTALYTIRIVSMVFYGRSVTVKSLIYPGPAMRLPLGLLAIGTLTTWMLAGPFSQLLARTLPYHQLSGGETHTIVSEIIAAPATWLAMIFITLGIVIWLAREKLVVIPKTFQPLSTIAQNDLGFEWLNDQLSKLVGKLASLICLTQTGQLNWNIVEIIGGFIVLLSILLLGAR